MIEVMTVHFCHSSRLLFLLQRRTSAEQKPCQKNRNDLFHFIKYHNSAAKVQQKNEIRKEKRKKSALALAYIKKKQYLCSPKDKQFYFMFIIGIAGGTGSGKTTVVKKLIERLPKNEVVVIPQDSYYKDSSNVPVEERQNINFDHPDAFDWALLTKHIAMLKEGQPIEQPIYSYITCTRQEETVHIEPKDVIVVEGIMALREPKMRAQMDLKIFVDADADDRLIRVMKRDVVERGRSAEQVIERYQRVLKPMHEQFIEPCKRFADVIVPQGGHNNAAINMLAKFVKQQLRERD